jgi:hypothetical protein
MEIGTDRTAAKPSHKIVYGRISEKFGQPGSGFARAFGDRQTTHCGGLHYPGTAYPKSSGGTKTGRARSSPEDTCGAEACRFRRIGLESGQHRATNLLACPPTDLKRCQMAKPNYAFEKRQRDLAKKQKKEEKLKRKTGTDDSQPHDQEAPPPPAGDDQPAT